MDQIDENSAVFVGYVFSLNRLGALFKMLCVAVSLGSEMSLQSSISSGYQCVPLRYINVTC